MEPGEGRLFKLRKAFVQNESWDDTVNISSNITVPTNKQLTLGAGTSVTFSSGTRLEVNHILIAQGTSSERISFTSVKSSPSRGDWYGIKFNDSSVDVSCCIEYADIAYATFGLYLYKASPKINHSNVDSCSVSGIYLYQSTPKIEYCDFTHNGSMGIWCASSYSYDYVVDWQGNDCDDNSNYGMYLEHSSPTIKENSICNNSSIGIYTYGTNTVPFFSHSLIKYNGSDGVRSVTFSQPRFHYYPVGIGGCCEIVGNGGRGVYALSYSIPFLGLSSSYSGNNSIYDNSSSSTIYAEDNWWDSASGPGQGETNGDVDYTPYLDEMPGCWQRMAGGENVYPEYSESPEYYNRLGTIYLMEGKYDQAASLFQDAISEFPNDERTKYSLLQLVFCYEMMGKDKEIVIFLDDVAEKFHSQDLGLFALVQSISYLEKGGEPQAALDRCRYLLDQCKDEQMRKGLLFQMGNIYLYGLEDESGAEKAFKEVIDAFPEDDLAVIAEAKLVLLGATAPLPKFAYHQESVPQIPDAFELSQNFPNPFNPITSIQYSVASDQSPSNVTLKIYNILGQEIRALVDEPKDAGYYTVTWDGMDDQGKGVSSGVYFYRLLTDNFVQTKKMVLMR